MDFDWFIIIEFLHAASWCALLPRPPPATPRAPAGGGGGIIYLNQKFLISRSRPRAGAAGAAPWRRAQAGTKAGDNATACPNGSITGLQILLKFDFIFEDICVSAEI